MLLHLRPGVAPAREDLPVHPADNGCRRRSHALVQHVAHPEQLQEQVDEVLQALKVLLGVLYEV